MLTYGKTGTAPGTTVLTIPHADAFGAVPDDFDVSRAHLTYQRFYHGWVPGTLGQVPTSPEAALAELEVYRARLAAEKAVADLRHTQSSHTWMIVGGLVGIMGVVVSVIALTRGN